LTGNIESNYLIYESPDKKIKFAIDEIKSLEYYSSYGRWSGWYSFERYRFCKIILKDKGEIIITSIMIYKIERAVEKLIAIKANKNLKVVAFILNCYRL